MKDPRNNPNWQGGLSFEEYSPEFDSSLKEQVRFRDKYKCQLCGCSQLENGKQLDVHHKDYNKRNNNINNLISLCVRCHRKTNHNRVYWIERLK
jgi:5-methylcytosine-specific restriction endonuclease McrA